MPSASKWEFSALWSEEWVLPPLTQSRMCLLTSKMSVYLVKTSLASNWPNPDRMSRCHPTVQVLLPGKFWFLNQKSPAAFWLTIFYRFLTDRGQETEISSQSFYTRPDLSFPPPDFAQNLAWFLQQWLVRMAPHIAPGSTPPVLAITKDWHNVEMLPIKTSWIHQTLLTILLIIACHFS